jgi:hypothetical protein
MHLYCTNIHMHTTMIGTQWYEHHAAVGFLCVTYWILWNTRVHISSCLLGMHMPFRNITCCKHNCEVCTNMHIHTCVQPLLLTRTHYVQLQAMALHLSRVLIRNADSTLQINKSKASQTASSGSSNRKLHPVEVGHSPLTMNFNSWTGVLMQLKLARDKTEAAQIVALMQKAQFIRPALVHHHQTVANSAGTIQHCNCSYLYDDMTVAMPRCLSLFANSCSCLM